jgi:two-component sensor histidine kinase
MHKYWLVWYFILGRGLFAAAQAHQTATAAEVLKHYTAAERRLLIESTVHVINLISQYNLDQDSITLIACKADSLPFLTAYGEVLDDQFSPGAGLINDGRIGEAIKMLPGLQAESQMRLLLELTIFYLHQPGKHSNDLDSAGHFLQLATQMSASGSLSHWQNNCALIQGELEFQLGLIQEAHNTVTHVVTIANQDKDLKTQALAYRQLNTFISDYDSIQLRYCDTALKRYQQLGSREGEINMLWTLALLNYFREIKPAKECMLRITELQKTIGFKHTLYSQYFLSMIYLYEKDYITGMNTCIAGLENMRWSGITAVQSLFYMRMGNAYTFLYDKKDSAIAWFRRGVDARTPETHVFWYKSLLYLTNWESYNGHEAESLDILQRITAEYPPLTVWEQLQVLCSMGYCYQSLGDYANANKYYTAFLTLLNKFPNADPWGENLETIFVAAEYYLVHHEPQKAQLFINSAGNYRQFTTFKLVTIRGVFYDWQYRIDSIEGKYAAALKDHILYQRYYDSGLAMEQTRMLDEINQRYATGKKDQDIRLLQQQALVRQAQLQHQVLTRNVSLAGAFISCLIVLLLYRQYQIKTRANAAIGRKNESLNKLVSEKEWLLKEVHHRVKNNLQTIINLLELPADSLHADPLSAIQASQNRIFATSLLHQKLYQGDDMSSVNMGVYIPELIHYLQEAFHTRRQIKFEARIEPIDLDISQAVPIGIIINEVVTNAIKHAFPSRPENAAIRISLEMIAGDAALLQVSDNGLGVSAGLAQRKSGLGLRLVSALTADIDGVVEMVSGPGTTVSVRFAPRALLNRAKEADRI